MTAESALLAAALAAWADAHRTGARDRTDACRREAELACLDDWAATLAADAAELDGKRHCHTHRPPPDGGVADGRCRPIVSRP